MKIGNDVIIQGSATIEKLPVSSNSLSAVVQNDGNLFKRELGTIVTETKESYIPGLSVSFPSLFNLNTEGLDYNNRNLVVSFKNQQQGTALMAPVSMNGTPSFRRIVKSDLSDASVLFSDDARISKWDEAYTSIGNYVPYTGATSNVNLGTRSITSTGGFIGNASTATTLATARTINGTSFNGSANITTANWGTSRNFTIGNTTKAVNGSGNVSWSLAEIGASALSHTHPISDIVGLQTELNKIGNLPSLTTTDKSNLVNAINEVNGKTSALDDFGGRNYQPDITINGAPSRASFSAINYKTISITFQNTAGSTPYCFINKLLPFEPGQYVFRFFIKVTSSTSNNITNVRYGLRNTGSSDQSAPVTNGVWTEISNVFNLTTYSVNSCLILFTNDYLHDVTFEVKDVKLEKGITPTDWTPAPEDQVSDWNETDNTKYSFIKNKPTIPTSSDFITTNTTQTGLSGSKTTTGNLTHTNSDIIFNRNILTASEGLKFRTNGLLRWGISQTSESAGSQDGLIFRKYDDAGAYSGYSLYLNRQTGTVSTQGGFIISGRSNSDIVLAGGGHRPVSDFALASQLPTVNNGALTLSTGTGLSGSANFTANQSGNSSFSVGIANTHKLPTVAEWNALPTTNTITRLRGTTSGTFTSGDLTLLAGANTIITQSGANITIASTNTNTTYTAGTGLSLTGTTFANTAPNATHTGDVTGSTALTIANNAVTFAKMQNIATQRFLGRVSSGTGNVEALTASQMQSALGYLTSFTETDPTVPSHVKSITTTNISNWNTAFGWGDHSQEGYAVDTNVLHTNATAETKLGKLTIDNDFEVSGISNQSGIYDTGIDSIRVLNPKGAIHQEKISSVTGAIKITLPRLYSTTMQRFRVDVYNYKTNSSFSVMLGGYNYSTGSWLQTFAQVLNGENKDYTIRFGDDGVNSCVWIGELNSNWNYPIVSVTDFIGGFNNVNYLWAKNWGISFVTVFDKVTITLNNNYLYADWNKLKDKPTDLLHTADLNGYATETWVNSQGFSTQTLSSSTSNIISGSTVQRAALTGDVTASQNSNATTIANSAVTHAKYQNIATQRILGRGATGTGNVQELTLGANLSLSTAGVLSATNTTYSTGAIAELNSGTVATGRLWGSNVLNSWLNGKGFLTSVPTMTATVEGTAKLFSATVQSVASTAVSATASRTYGIQKNSSGQLVVNVPWTNSTYSLISLAEITNPNSVETRLISGQRLDQWATDRGFTSGIFEYSTQGGIQTMDWNSYALGDKSIAIGSVTTANGFAQVAIGTQIYNKGVGSISTGFIINDEGTYNTLNGAYLFNRGDNAVLSGLGIRNYQSGHIVTGQYNDFETENYDVSLSLSKPEAVPLFTLGNGTSDLTRSNAFRIYREGSMELYGRGFYRDDKRDPSWFTKNNTLADVQYVNEAIASSGSNYTLPIATTSIRGGLRATTGTTAGYDINASTGIMTMRYASSTQKGMIRVGNGLVIDINGILSTTGGGGGGGYVDPIAEVGIQNSKVNTASISWSETLSNNLLGSGEILSNVSIERTNQNTAVNLEYEIVAHDNGVWRPWADILADEGYPGKMDMVPTIFGIVISSGSVVYHDILLKGWVYNMPFSFASKDIYAYINAWSSAIEYEDKSMSGIDRVNKKMIGFFPDINTKDSFYFNPWMN